MNLQKALENWQLKQSSKLAAAVAVVVVEVEVVTF